MRVLIAEDNALVALMMEVVLRDDGHKVVGTATTAREALSLIEEERPDLLIADFHLEDGESGCDLVVEAHKRWGTPALFVSGWADKVQSDIAIGVLSKPFFSEAVHAAVHIAEEILQCRPHGPIPRQLRLFPEFKVPPRHEETTPAPSTRPSTRVR